MKEGKYAGVIGVGGLVLARIPEEIAKAREDYLENKLKIEMTQLTTIS